MRAQAAALYDFAEGILTFETSLDSDTRTVLNLVRDVLFTEKFLVSHAKPRYLAYSNLLVLNRFLLEGQAAPLAAKWSSAKKALALVILDWHEREQDRLSMFTSGRVDPTLLGYTNEEAPGDSLAHLHERLHVRRLQLFAQPLGNVLVRVAQDAVDHLRETA